MAFGSVWTLTKGASAGLKFQAYYFIGQAALKDQSLSKFLM